PSEIVIKQVANRSKDKVTIIQGVDRKLPLEDIAQAIGLSLESLLEEMNQIVESGTKLDIGYYIEENLDDDVVEEIFDYFHDASFDSIEDAFQQLKDDDITMEELALTRIKFMTEIVN